MVSPPAGPGPHEERHEAGDWLVVVRSVVGRVRRRLEDAWRILPDGRLGDRRVHAFAIFDGLGGMPRGQEGAWAAADALDRTLEASGSPDALLERLNEPVVATGGNTTADVALFFADESPGDGVLLAIGDSSAYDLWEGGPRRLAPHDATGPTSLTDFLGLSSIGGHTVGLHVPAGGNLVLCTDGVDGVVGERRLLPLLEAGPDDLAREADQVLRHVEDAGSPDNATVVAAHRRA